MDIKKIKCPNCGGDLVISDDDQRKICAYCDSEFILKKRAVLPDNVPKQQQNKKIRALELFDISQVDTFNSSGIATWKVICALINCNYDLKQYMECIQKLAQKNTDIATAKVNTNLMAKALKRVSCYLEKGEEALVFKDSTFFGIIGKEGNLLTNKKIYFFTKKQIFYLDLRQIVSIKKTSVGSGWYCNDCRDYYFDTMRCSEKELGVLISMSCTMARELNPAAYRIKVLKEN